MPLSGGGHPAGLKRRSHSRSAAPGATEPRAFQEPTRVQGIP